MSMSNRNQMRCMKIIIFISSFAISLATNANPVVSNISSGNVTIQQAGNTTTINQTSQSASINWQSFNIGQHEVTHFQQPAGGVALNRISASEGPSAIYGQLTATGEIILINPAGIFFGPTAHVNVGSLIATTANITDSNFLNGNYHFVQAPGYKGIIINAGTLIAAQHGLIALIGNNVTNNGHIQANLGHIVLASGGAFTLSFAGNDLINFSVDEKALNQGGVTNTGTLVANGGTIQVSADAASNVLNDVINMGGVAQAESVGKKQGEIILSGGATAGVVEVSGKLNVSGKRAGQTGGTVSVTGDDILLDSTSVIDASGAVSGGNIFVGGNAHGAGPLPDANAAVVMPGATLRADAITNGNGGNIVVWSNEMTKMYGDLSAEGGALGGSGGWIETSSANYLDVNGSQINVTAPHGSIGTWLLDPSNIYIADSLADAQAAGMTSSDTSASTESSNTFAATTVTVDSFLLNSTLDTALNSANILVTTTNANGTGTGNISVVSPISWSSGNTLTLTAAHNISINAAITTGTSASALTLNATGSVTQNASGIIGGAGALTQAGTGTTTLSQTNTYSGGTNITAGTLAVSTDSNLGAASGELTINGGILENLATYSTNLNRGVTIGPNGGTIEANTLTITGVLTGGGLLTVADGGLILTGTSNSNTGNILLNTFGDLTISTDSSLGSTTQITLNGGTLTVSPGSSTLTISSSRNIEIGANGGTISLSGTTIYGGVISDSSGNGQLTISGTGTLQLTGLNTYTGRTDILGNSVLEINQDANLGAAPGTPTANSLEITGTLDVTSGFTLNPNRKISFGDISSHATIEVDSGTLIYNGIMSGDGFIKTGAGTLNLGGVSTYSGTTTISAGTLKLGVTNAIPSTSGIDIITNGTLNLNGYSDTVASLSSDTTANITLAGATLTTNDSGTTDTYYGTLGGSATDTGTLVMGGTGTLTLAGSGQGANGGSGVGLTVNGGGTLALASTFTGSYGGAVNISNGKLSIASTTGLGSSSGVTITSGGELDIPGVTISGTQPISIVGNGLITGNGAIYETTGTGGLGGAITLAGNASIGAANGTTLNLTGAMNDGTNPNYYTLTLNNNNTTGSINATSFAGSTSNAASILAINDGNATFTGAVTADSLTTTANDTNVTLGGGGTITNAVSFLNTGNTSLSGTLTFTGGLNATAGTTILNTGTVSTTGSNNITLGTTTVAGNSTVEVATGTLTLGTTNSSVAGTNSLTAEANGAGTLTLGTIGGINPLNTFTAEAGISSTGTPININNNINTSGTNNGITIETDNSNIAINNGSLAATGGTVLLGFTNGSGTITETSGDSGAISANALGTIGNPNVVTLNNANNNVSTLAGEGSSFSYVNGSGTLTIGTVGSVSGISVGSTASITNDNGNITVNQPIPATTGEQVLLTAEGNGTNNTLTINANVGTAGANNQINLVADNMVISSQVYGGTVDISPYLVTTPISVGGSSASSSGTLGLTNTELGLINSIDNPEQISSGTGGSGTAGVLTIGNLNVTGNYTFNVGNTININNPIGNTTTPGQLFFEGTNGISLGANVTASSGITFASPITLTAGSTVTGASTLSIEYLGAISGSGSGTVNFTSNGSGLVTFGSTVNVGTITNPVNLIASGSSILLEGSITTAGTQDYQSPTVLGANNITLNSSATNGSITFNSTIDNHNAANDSLSINTGSGPILLDGSIGSGSNGALNFLTLTSTGSVTLGTAGTSTTVSAFSVNSNASSGTTTLDTSSITTAAGQTYNNVVLGASSPLATALSSSAGGALIINGTTGLGSNNLSWSSSSTTSVIDGVISGSGSLKYLGTGKLTLDGANTYTGSTTVTAGILDMGVAGSLSDTSGITVASGGELDIGAFTATGSPALYIAGNGVSGNGALFENASAGTGTFNGAITLTANASIGAKNGSTLDLTSISDGGGSNYYTATLNNNNTTGTINATVFTGSLSKTGSILAINAGSAAFSGFVTADSLTTTANATNVALDGGGTITNAVSFLNTGNTTLGGTLAFNGGLTATAGTTVLNTGTVTAASNNLTLGTTTVAGNSTVDVTNGTLTLGTTDSSVAGSNSLTADIFLGSLVLGTIGGNNPLNTFTAETGGSGSSGVPININNNINTSGTNNSITIETYSNNITINNGSLNASGGTVTFGFTIASGAPTITETNGDSGAITANVLGITGLGAITLNNVNNAVNTLAATGNSSFSYTNASSTLTIGTVGSLNGITSTGATASPISITNNGNLTVNQPITTNKQAITLTAEDTGSNNTLTVNAAVGQPVAVSGSNTSLVADNIAINATVGGYVVNINPYLKSTAFSLGGTSTSSSGTLGLSNAAIAMLEADNIITFDNGTVGSGTAGAMTIGNFNVNGAVYSFNSSNTININAPIGNTTPPGVVLFVAPNGISLGANVTASGEVDFVNPVTLTAGSTVTGGGSTSVNYGGTVTGNGSGTVNFISNGTGNVIFGTVNVGTMANPVNLSASGSSITLDGSITTAGTQDYQSPTVLGANNITLNSSATNGSITFNSTIDLLNSTVRPLAINAGSGSILLDGNIGSGANGAIGALTLTSTGSVTLGTAATSSTVDAASVSSNASGGTTILDTSSITTTGAQTYNNVVLGSSNALTTPLSGTAITINGTTSLGANSLSVANSAASVIDGGISGSGSLIAMGTSTLVLAAANTYTGATTVSGGTLSLTNANALGSSGSESSGISVSSTANLDLNFAAGTLGNTQTLTLNGAGVGGNGSLTFSGSGDIVNNPVTLNSNTTIGGAGNGTISNTITDNGSDYSLTKVGASNITLSGANTYSGGTAINAGILSANTNNTALGSGNVTIANNAELFLSGLSITNNITSVQGTGVSNAGAIVDPNSVINGNITLSGNTTFGVNTGDTMTINGIIGDGGSGYSITESGAGTLVLTAANTYSGATTIGAGVLQISADDNLGTAPISPTVGQLTINGGTLDATGGFILNSNRGIALGGNSTIEVDAGTLTYNGLMAGSNTLTVTSASTGNLTLGGANTLYTGATKIGNGVILTATNVASLGNTSGGTILVNTGGELDINLGGATLVNNKALTLNGSGTNAALYEVGTSADTIANTITLGSATTIGAASGGTLSFTGGIANAGFTTTFVGAGNITESTAAITGSGGLTMAGSGTLKLGVANSSYTGITTINAGTLQAAVSGALGSAAGGVINIDPLSTTPAILDLTLISSLTNTHAINFTSTNANAKLNTALAITLSNPISLTGTANIFDVNTTTTTLSNAITGTGGLEKNDTGNLSLTVGSSGNTYSGATIINAGILQQATNANSLPIDSDITLANASGVTLTLNNLAATVGSIAGGGTTGGTVSLGSGTLTTGDTVATTFGGVITGTGALVKVGADTFTLSNTNNAYGNTTINDGSLVAAVTHALGTTGTITVAPLVTDTAILDLSQLTAALANTHTITLNSSAATSNAELITAPGVSSSYTMTNAFTLTGSNNSILINNGTLLLSGILSGSGALISGNSGATLTLSGANTYSGGTTINNETLNFGVSSTGAITNGPVGKGTLILNNATLTANSSTITVANAYTLSGNSTTTIGGTNSLTLSGAGTLGSGNTLAITNTGTTTLSGTLNGSAPINENTTGQLTVGASSINNDNYSGIVTLTTGTLFAVGTDPLGIGNLDLYGGEVEGSSNTIVNPFTIEDGAPVSFGGSASFTLTNNGSIGVNNSATVLTDNGTGNTITFNGILSGPGGINQNGNSSSTLVLNGINIFTGQTNINNGTVEISADSGLGAAPNSFVPNQLTLNGGTLELDSNGAVGIPGGFRINSNRGITLDSSGGTIVGVGINNDFIYNGIIAGSGALTFSSNNSSGNNLDTITLSNTSLNPNTYSGQTNIGTDDYIVLQVYSDYAFGSSSQLTVNGGILQTSASFTSNRPIQISVNGAYFYEDPGVTFTENGLLTGSANAFNQFGSGTLQLGNTNNTFVASFLTVNDGVLQPTSVGALGDGSITTIQPDSSSAHPVLDFSMLSAAPSHNFSILLAGGVDNAPATLIFANNYTFPVKVIAEPTSAAGYNFININSGGNISFSDIQGTGTINFNGQGTATINDASGLSGAAITLSAGTVAVGNATALGTDAIVFSGGSLQSTTSGVNLANTFSISNGDTATIDGSNSITLSGAGSFGNSSSHLINDNTATTTLSNTLTGSGMLSQNAGTLVVSGANTSFTGPTAVNAGTLSLGSVTALGATGTITIAGGNVATLDFNFPTGTLANASALSISGTGVSSNGVLTFSGTGDTITNPITLTGNTAIGGVGSGTINAVINDGGDALSLSKLGAGTVTLSAANTYTGGTTISGGGTAIVGNNAALGTGLATVNAGSVLQIDNGFAISNALSLAGAGISNNGALIGTGASGETVSGSINLAGDTTINAPNVGDLLNVTGSTITGNGHQLNLIGAGTMNIGDTVSGVNTLVSQVNTTISADITTTNAQTYHNPVTLGATVTLGGDNIDFMNTVAGAGYALTLNDTGTSTIAAVITGISSLQTNAVDIGANVTTTGNQNYTGAVTLAANVSMTASGTSANDITFTNGVMGSKNLTLISDGSGSNYTLDGSLSAANITVAPAGTTNNQLTVGTGGVQTWSLTGSDGGSITAGSPIAYSDVQNLNGGNGQNNFILSGGTVSGSINGGSSAANTVTGANVSNVWNITGVNAGNVTGVNSFTNIETVVGGNTSNQFNLSGGSIDSIVGGGSNNTLNANDNTSNNWSISGTNAGTVSGVNSFSNIQNLTGGSQGNTFVFNDGATLTGMLNAGSLSASNTLNFNNYTTSVNAYLGTNIYNGTMQNGATPIVNYTNANNLVGNIAHTNIINLSNAANDIVVQGGGSGSINDPVNFSGFTILTAPVSNNNTVSFTVPATIISNNTAVVNGVLMTFNNFNLVPPPAPPEPEPAPTPTPDNDTSATSSSSVSAIILQPLINNLSNPLEVNTSPIATTVSNNIDAIIAQINRIYACPAGTPKNSWYCNGTIKFATKDVIK